MLIYHLNGDISPFQKPLILVCAVLSAITYYLVPYHLLMTFQPVLHNWYKKGYPVCGIVHIKDALLLIEESSPQTSGRVFLLYLSHPPTQWWQVFVFTYSYSLGRRIKSLRWMKSLVLLFSASFKVIFMLVYT